MSARRELEPIGRLLPSTLELIRFRALHYRDRGALAVLAELEELEAPQLPLDDRRPR